VGVSVQELPLVLVIEDDADIQVIVEDALTEGGFEPAIAASGEEARHPSQKRLDQISR
jgi:DNA-binding response OmpR family regulator